MYLLTRLVCANWLISSHPGKSCQILLEGIPFGLFKASYFLRGFSTAALLPGRGTNLDFPA